MAVGSRISHWLSLPPVWMGCMPQASSMLSVVVVRFYVSEVGIYSVPQGGALSY